MCAHVVVVYSRKLPGVNTECWMFVDLLVCRTQTVGVGNYYSRCKLKEGLIKESDK